MGLGATSDRDAVQGGAAVAMHGALQTGVLATTFTASQGLLLKSFTAGIGLSQEVEEVVQHVVEQAACEIQNSLNNAQSKL
jgi:pyruvate/2-oxoacid:ferredoxin oxidoreductase alpha subunit